MGKATKATKKFAQKHLANVIQSRKDNKEAKELYKRKENKEKKRKRNATTTEEEELDLGQQTKVAKTQESVADMDVDEFLEDGFFKALDGKGKGAEDDSQDEDSDAEDVMDDADEEDEIAQYKKDLEELKKDSKQAEFLKYLEDEAPELLDMEDLEQDDAEEEKEDDKRPLLTLALLETWKTAFVKSKSLPAFKRLIAAFRVAVHMSHEEDDEQKKDDENDKKKKGSKHLEFKIDGPEVFNDLVTFVIINFPRGLANYLGDSKANKDENKFSGKGFVAKNYPAWSKVKPAVYSYFKSLITFTEQLSDPKMLGFVLQHTENAIFYLSPFLSLAKKFLKLYLSLWASAAETVRIYAFFCIRKLALDMPFPFIDNVLKGSYLTYVRHAKYINRGTIGLVQFLCNCIVELYGLDFVSSYQHAFVYIRELAAHLRMSFTSKKKSTRKNIYNFQYVNSINAWVRVLAAYPGQEHLALLYYPLVQLIQGTIAYQPTNRYYPLRLRCIQMLIELGASSKSYVNAASYALEILATPDVCKKPKPSMEKVLDVRLSLKVPKAAIGTKIYQDVIADQALDLLVEYLALYSRSISFPELVLPVVSSLTKFKKNTHNISHSKRAKTILEKIATTSKLIQAKRANVNYSPKEIAMVSNFLGEEATPLTIMRDDQVARAKAELEKYMVAQKDAKKAKEAQYASDSSDEDVEEDAAKKDRRNRFMHDDDDDDDDEESSSEGDAEAVGSDDDVVQDFTADMLSEDEDKANGNVSSDSE